MYAFYILAIDRLYTTHVLAAAAAMQRNAYYDHLKSTQRMTVEPRMKTKQQFRKAQQPPICSKANRPLCLVLNIHFSSTFSAFSTYIAFLLQYQRPILSPSTRDIIKMKLKSATDLEFTYCLILD